MKKYNISLSLNSYLNRISGIRFNKLGLLLHDRNIGFRCFKLKVVI